MKRGFTLIELMAASLLLAMLVTVLTMIFNQSSIAWRTGIARVASLGDARRDLGYFHEECDDLLPGLGGTENRIQYRTVSFWKKYSQGGGDGRLFDSISPIYGFNEAQNGSAKGISAAGTGISSSLFTVGVRSAGPDRVFGTKDDITTWPENAN